MKKIKILFGLEAAEGGAMKHLVYLISYINPELFDITVFLSNKRKEKIDKSVDKLNNAGAKVIFLPMERSIRPLSDFQCFLKILVHIKKDDYDIVHAHSSKAGVLFRIAAWLGGVTKIFYTPHCFYFQQSTGLKKNVFLIIEKAFAFISTKIIVSKGEMDTALNLHLSSANKLLNINNAIDFNQYSNISDKSELRKKYCIPEKDKIISAIGRLVAQKDWMTFIRAAQYTLTKKENITFLIVGEGDLEKELLNEIERLNLKNKIKILGFINEINEIFAITDVFVNTSLYEGLPYVYLEAMYFKKPIVATSINNEKDILDQKTGLLASCKDYKKIGNNILNLLENQTLLDSMGNKGYQHILENYSFAKFISEHERIYME